MRAKFKRGDKVRFTNRATQHATQDLRQRTRTIVDAHYDPVDQCIYYELGDRWRATKGFLFRSYMLRLVKNEELQTIGQPRKRRKYQHKIAILRTKLPIYHQNRKLGDHPPRVVAVYPNSQDFAVEAPLATPTKYTDIPAMARAGGHRIKSEKTVGNESPVLANQIAGEEK